MSCLHSEDYAILGTVLVITTLATTIGGCCRHAYSHWARAHRVEVKAADLSQIEKKPQNHWLCGKCRWEDKKGKAFTPTILTPDITRVTVKPMYGSDKIQQVVLETPQGKRVRYIPKSHNEVTIETAKGTEIFDLQTQTSRGTEQKTGAPVTEEKASTNAWYLINGPMSALRDLYQNTHS